MSLHRTQTYSYLTTVWRNLTNHRTRRCLAGRHTASLCTTTRKVGVNHTAALCTTTRKVGVNHTAALCTTTRKVGVNHTRKEEVNTDAYHHEPILVREVLDKLQPKPGQVFLDMTFGGGGHTKALLRHTPDLKLFCLDRDPVAYHRAQKLAQTHDEITPLHGKFSEVYQLLHEHGYGPESIDGVLFDLGASSMQFDDPSTGFSINQGGPLDMRMDRGSSDSVTAEDVVNSLDESGLYKILKRYGEEKRSRDIARAIVDSRYAFGRIQTTTELAKVVASVFEGAVMRDKLYRQSHVATRTFQALRIFINNELNELHNGLSIVHKLLPPGGRCVAISFHSLEDRIVKRHFHSIDMDTKLNMSVGDQARAARGQVMLEVDQVETLLHKDWEPIIRGAIMPCDGEILENPRSRSAKLRAARKI